MKKILLTATIAVSLISSAFASPLTDVNYVVRNNFVQNFGNITDVKWAATSSYAKATFILDNVETEAFYKPNGDFIGTSQAIAVEELPIAAKRSFAKKYGNFTVKEAIKFEGNEETAYFISANYEKQSVVLRADNNGISIYEVSNRN